MLGIIPAAWRGSRIQPLGFSKELLPVGSRLGDLGERPCAVSEYLLDRMVAAGADKLCFVIGPGKSDILEYYAEGYRGAATVYVVQPRPSGLCDAIFRARALVGENEQVLVGLPDTIWFPINGFAALPKDELSFLLFPVETPEHFDAVVVDDEGWVRRIEVKQPNATSHWVWGAFAMPAPVFRELLALWQARQRADEYMGTLVNAYLAQGGRALGIKAGETYVDVGTIGGYRQALRLLADADAGAASPQGAAVPPAISPTVERIP